jgi:hypothetical protein
MTKNFSIEEHIHRFGVWTAARAASKSLLSNLEIENLLEAIKLKDKISALRECGDLNHTSYSIWLKDCCDELIEAVNASECVTLKKKRFSHGLAAKVISIYIKTVEVIPTKGASTLSAVAFPPIDSILLRNINSKYNKKLNIRWSKFGWPEYTLTIQALQQINGDRPMWQLESEWFNPKKVCNTQTTANL